MDKELRFLIINYSNKPQTCTITFSGDDISFSRCAYQDTVDNDAENPDIHITKAASGYGLVVPRGEICGFFHLGDVVISNPMPDKVLVITATGKNPWPPPPLAPAKFKMVGDYEDRYYNFAGGSAGGSADEMKIRYSTDPTLPPAAPAASSANPESGK